MDCRAGREHYATSSFTADHRKARSHQARGARCLHHHHDEVNLTLLFPVCVGLAMGIIGVYQVGSSTMTGVFS